MKTVDEPPYLTVGTDVSAKYRGAFCEAKIKNAKRLVKVKVTFKHDSSVTEVQDDQVKGPLKVGAVVEVKDLEGTFQEAVITKLTDASWYTVVFDDGDEKTLRRSSLCLKGERHFAESETLDQLPLTNPEHFGTPVIAKKPSRGRRANNVPEEESLSSSSSDEGEEDQRLEDELLGKVVCVESVGADRRACCYPGLVICSDCNDDVVVKKDSVLVRSFKDGKFASVPRKDIAVLNSQMVPKMDADMTQVVEHAYEFVKNGSIPSVWKMELKEESSSSEEDETDDDEDDDDKDKEDSTDEEEEVEPFPEEKENFLHQLYKFMEDRGTPINKRPVLGYMNLNLFKLYRLVHRLGGFSNIESGAVWKQVYQDLGIPVLNSAAGYNVKCAYRKYLYGFEEYCGSAGIRFQMAMPEKISQKRSKENTRQKDCKSEPSLENNSKILEAMEQVEKHEEYQSEKQEHDRFSEEKKKIIHDCAFSVDLDKEKESKKAEMEFEDHIEQPKYTVDEMHQSTNTDIKEEPEQNEKSRYDEWIKADKIIRPVDKNVPKIKHRKKIKNKTNTEKELAEGENKDSLSSVDLQYLSRSLSQNLSDKCGPKFDSETKNVDSLAVKSTDTAAILNGMPVSDCSSEDTEQEDFTLLDTKRNANNEGLKDAPMHKDSLCDSQQTEEHHVKLQVGSKGFDSVLSATLKDSAVEFNQEQATLSEDESDQEELLVQRKKLQLPSDQLEKTQVKVSKRRCVHTQNWLKTSSSDRRTKRTKGKELFISMNSSSSEEEADGTNKGKFSSSRKYNGIDAKTKPVRTLGFFSTFSEIPSKRLKPHNSSEERIQNTRAKERKDVWSSIKGQWPKKILKELFSDSDTETAASPPHESVEEVDANVQVEPTMEDKNPSVTVTEVSVPVITDTKSSEDKAFDVSDKKTDFPSSGSNSLLNTPPATPESPAQNVTEPCRTLPTVAVPHALPTNQEEVQSIRSETDSTVEVDSVVGEMQDLQSEGNVSPTGFDASVSSSSSNVPEPEHKDKVPTCQKRFKDAQGGGLAKKLKQVHKCSGVLSRIKSVNSSDSEDLSGPESSVKSPQVKTVSLEINTHHHITKSPSRTQVPGKCTKNGEKNLELKDSQLTKAHKWSFEMVDLERMTAEERISFLQEKLQEIRQHYLSLKAEVASIDRRKKRLKKKERDRAAVTSSSSSSPSSSSLTAAVMLTLADSSVAGSTQNGVSLECR